MIGRTLKNYVVEEMLGRGGMGVVYRARDTRLNRPVALKVLPPELVKDEDRRRRFIQEARAASAVNHPAIAQIYEIEEGEDLTYIVMEYVDGSTVRQLVAKGDLDIVSAVEVAVQVGEALARAHEAGIIHRDIKSDNIMVTRDGHPKILDFGLAKLLDVSTTSDEKRASQMETLARTQAGMIVGTLSYMSPEQARGLPADKRSDIFSFGVVLYEMSTGRMPFEGASAIDTIHAIAYEQQAPVTQIRADLPYSLQRVIDRCLRKKPEERYQDMREAVADLRTVKREIETGVTKGMPILERVQWWLSGFTTRGLIWAGAIGAILGAFLVLVLLGGEGNRIAPVVFFVGMGAFLYRRFRNRGHRMMRKFVRKASGLKEVRLVVFNKGEFTVIADNPTAKIYLKLNAFLGTANQRLYHGEPMTMVVRENLGEEEVRRLLGRSGVQYLRDDAKRDSELRGPASR